ncbi:MAG: Asp23/Gls24 family envelope stress response protein [Clostridia bacterium]|nr:Asp23/Gls24 family envelope stress response protein [Clostridia bacterium]
MFMFVNGELYEKNDEGRVYCGKNIMLSIINLAAKEISGVASLCSHFAGRFKRLFSSNYFEGVKVTYTQNKNLIIDIYLEVFLGYSVADVAYRVQENVKNGISNMISAKIDSINIHVLGVEFSREDLAKY